MAMLNTNQWNEFKESVQKAGFLTNRLDDENRDLKRSDSIFKLDIVEKFLTTEQLETLSLEEIIGSAERYIYKNIKPQFKDKDGNDEWYDETYYLWYDAFEYAALFHRLTAFEVECKYR